MSLVNQLPNGIGEVLGDPLVVVKPFSSTGDVWYVNSATGTDGAAPAGKDREKPLQTLGQALTNAAANDLVVLEDGHTEVLAAAITISKSLTILGGGFSSGKPTVKFTMNSAGADTFILTAAGIWIGNIYFPPSQQSNGGTNGAKVYSTTATNVTIRNCYFEMGANDGLAGIGFNAAGSPIRIRNTTIVSTATSSASRPLSGVIAGGAAADVEVDGLVLDDGTVGFQSAAWSCAAQTFTRLRVENLSLLRGAKFLQGSATTGFLAPPITTGGARVNW